VNLLSNAINYSPEGSEITVSVFQEKNCVTFKVSDNGPGIAEEDLPHLFERFYSRHHKSGGGRRGMGLGLSLCKSIVEAHGGEISIGNRATHGTTVSFTIPIREEDQHAAADSDR
jgi:two-component system sensor histidine kinase KdpD